MHGVCSNTEYLSFHTLQTTYIIETHSISNFTIYVKIKNAGHSVEFYRTACRTWCKKKAGESCKNQDRTELVATVNCKGWHTLLLRALSIIKIQLCDKLHTSGIYWSRRENSSQKAQIKNFLIHHDQKYRHQSKRLAGS